MGSNPLLVTGALGRVAEQLLPGLAERYDLSAARNHGVRRVVFASSVHAKSVYEGLGRWPIDPAWPPAPCCAYGATKAFDEALAGVYAYRSAMSLIGLRLGLCAPAATAAETAAGWLAPADLQQIVIGPGDGRDVGVYHAVSRPSRQRGNLDPTRREHGYEPDREGPSGADADDDSAARHLSTCMPTGADDGPAEPVAEAGSSRGRSPMSRS
jgi:hypothetical protein